MASVRLKKPPNGWEIRAWAGVDPVTGKRQQISRSHRGTKREAQRVGRDLEKEIDAGRHRYTEGTVSYLLEQWWEHGSPGWAPKTRERRRGVIDNRLVPVLGAIRLSHLRPSDLDRAYRGWSKGLAPATVAKYHADIHAALEQAVRWEWINANPADRATSPSKASPPIDPPSAAQVVKMIEAAAGNVSSGRHAGGPRRHYGPEFAAFLWVAATTGARRGEMCGLRHRDVDLANCSLRIRRSVSEVAGELHVKGTKTDDERSVGLDPATTAIIEAHMTAMAKRAVEAEVDLAADPYLFSDAWTCDEPWRPSWVTSAWRTTRERVGLRCRLHDLRHFSATELLTAGVDVRTVSGRLGHHNAAMTLGIYAAFVRASDERAATIIGERLRPVRDGAGPPEGEPAP